jgi:hypothetical protein
MSDYEEKLERKLIQQFKKVFENKMGYEPMIITKNYKELGPESIIPKGIRYVNLNVLKQWFDDLLPVINGKKISLESNRRYTEIVELRMFFSFIAKSLGYSLKAIGRHIGNRDHTTIIHNLTAFKNRMETDPCFQERYKIALNHVREKSKENDTELLECSDQTQDNDESTLFS